MRQPNMYQMFSAVFQRLKSPIIFTEVEAPVTQRHAATIIYVVTDKSGASFNVTCKLTAIKVEKAHEAGS